LPISRPIKRGDIYWLDWTPGRGSEQTGVRPALVVQSDIANAVTRYPITIVVAVSTKVKGYRSNVLIHPTAENGLTSPSEVVTGQLLTVTKERLTDHIGSLSASDMVRVDETLAYMIGLGN
jgi:mRNA interferase MazF